MTEFIFEETPWDLLLKRLRRGDRVSAVRCLALLEEMPEDAVEEALLALEDLGVALDVSDLPKDSGSGEAALRLKQERQLAESGRLMEKLDENDPLRLYLEELAAIAVAGDVEVLAERYAGGEDEVAQQMVNLSLSQVISGACAMTGRGVLLLDLIQEGSLGLWQGVLNYTGGCFEEHARWWIEQYQAKAVLLQARANGIGQKIRQGMEDYRETDQRLLNELGRNPTLEEIAQAIHVSVEEAEIYETVLNQAQARQRVERSMEPKEATPEDEQAVEDTAYFQLRQRILEMLSTLSKQEAALLTLRFGLEGGLPQTPQQTGDRMGLTVEEVVKLEAAALAKLRQQAE